MALTRKMLSAMEIPADKIEQIIEAHTESITALKDENEKLQKEFDAFKESNKSAGELQVALDKANTELAKLKSTDWEAKYSQLQAEYDDYKSGIQSKEIRAAKENAYRKILTDVGIASKRIDSIIKVSTAEIDAVEFDENGEIKDADTISENVKTTWADFIPIITEQGANVATPPANMGGDIKPKSYAAERVAQYRNEHYGSSIKED